MSDEQPPPGRSQATDGSGTPDVGPVEQTRLGERRRLRRERSQSEAESLAQRLFSQWSALRDERERQLAPPQVVAVSSMTRSPVPVGYDLAAAWAWRFLVIVAALAVVVGPWVYRLASDLSAEREERVRSQERADVAAHLHDSVLQTLALIQKSAHDGPTVARLARAQERDLRAWLFAGDTTDAATVSGALRAVTAELEDAHGVSVDVVVVGECPMTEGLRPLVAATREAVTNAAKHAGTGRVDVYAEVGPSLVEVFVRDRGAGFDLDAVPEDRQGVRGSIVDRMTRHGGRAEIRTAPGEGTEVRLAMPRDTAPQPPEQEMP